MNSVIASLLMMIVGSVFIFFAWNNNTGKQKVANQLCTATGWTCLLASLAVLISHSGAEFGITYGLCGASLVFIGVVAVNHQARASKAKPSIDLTPINIAPRQVMANLLHFIIAVPLVGALALLASLQLSQLFDWPTVNQLALVVILFPCIWATISYLYFYSKRRGFATILITIGISLFTTTLVLTR